MDPAFFRSLARLRLRVIQYGVEPTGATNTKHHGGFLEFRDYRDYLPGDDPRYLDWNVYARLQQLVIKQFALETQRHVTILVDASASMQIGNPSKLHLARHLAAGLAYIALNSGYQVRLSGCQLPNTDCVRTLYGRVPFSLLSTDLPITACGKVIWRPILQHYGRQYRGGLLVLISDLLVAEAACPVLTHLAGKGHTIWLLHLMANEELCLPPRGWLRLHDSESGQVRKLFVGIREQQQYQQNLTTWRRRWRVFTQQHHLGYCFVSTADSPVHILRHQLREAGWVR